MERMESDLRDRVADALVGWTNLRGFGADTSHRAADAALAALGLNDLDAFIVRVADDLYGVHSDAYRRGLVAGALEAAFTATSEGES